MADVEFEHRGRLGQITLNRPEALNALTHAMVREIHAQLEAWAGDTRVAAVAIRGAGGKAFSAGGDIRALYEAGRPGGERGRANFGFYADEYRLNHRIKTFPKPYVAVMDGIVMGGGVGVSVHGSHRIATERTVFAMPETGIGLFPDVGATWVLPRLPGETGMWLALTGDRLKGRAAVEAGVADVFLTHRAAEALIEALADGFDLPTDARALPEALADAARDIASDLFEDSAGAAPPDRVRTRERDALFAGADLGDILARLEASGSDTARAIHRTILSKSPTSTTIAFRQMREGARLVRFEDAMRLEYRLARYCMEHTDFYEGVRALIIDKDGAPAWSPSTLDKVDPAEIDRAFASLGAEELSL
ncbi:MAG: enoyl-CoA hydratase/isomerase family protein [Paracoccaceae bacterium]